MRRTTGLLAGIVLLAGCGDDRITADTIADAPKGMESVAASLAKNDKKTEIERDLEVLRKVTAPFHSFKQANASGWNTKITGCMTDPVAGGMGFHYGNPKFINATARVDEPELLLYEPANHGNLKLVAVEYIIPLNEWTSKDPPMLFGQKFKVNSVFQIWGLHVWLWKDNPSGLFADWNPLVNCDNTTDIQPMAMSR